MPDWLRAIISPAPGRTRDIRTVSENHFWLHIDEYPFGNICASPPIPVFNCPHQQADVNSCKKRCRWKLCLMFWCRWLFWWLFWGAWKEPETRTYFLTDTIFDHVQLLDELVEMLQAEILENVEPLIWLSYSSTTIVFRAKSYGWDLMKSCTGGTPGQDMDRECLWLSWKTQTWEGNSGMSSGRWIAIGDRGEGVPLFEI